MSFNIKVSSSRKISLFFQTSAASIFDTCKSCLCGLAASVSIGSISDPDYHIHTRQDARDDGHEVGDHFRAKEKGRKKTDSCLTELASLRKSAAAKLVLPHVYESRNKLAKATRRIAGHLQRGNSHLLV